MTQENLEVTNFDPFIGNKYEEQDFKLLILGESHHFDKNECEEFQEEPQKYKNITQEVLEAYFKYKNGEEPFKAWMNTFTRFANIYKNDNLSGDQSEEFWNTVSFYNYVQTPVDSARKSPTEEQFKNSHESFVKIVDQLKPNLIIVWGFRLWTKMQKNEHLKKGEIDFYCNIPVIVIPHPSSSTFDYTYAKAHFFENYIDKIKKHSS